MVARSLEGKDRPVLVRRREFHSCLNVNCFTLRWEVKRAGTRSSAGGVNCKYYTQVCAKDKAVKTHIFDSKSTTIAVSFMPFHALSCRFCVSGNVYCWLEIFFLICRLCSSIIVWNENGKILCPIITRNNLLFNIITCASWILKWPVGFNLCSEKILFIYSSMYDTSVHAEQ